MLYREALARMAQRNAAIEHDTVSGHYISVIRVLLARRETPFTVLGFMVKVDDVRERLFADLRTPEPACSCSITPGRVQVRRPTELNACPAEAGRYVGLKAVAADPSKCRSRGPSGPQEGHSC